MGPAGASIVSDDGTKIKLTGQQKKLIEKALKRMEDNAGTFRATLTEVVGKKGVGPAGQRVREMNKDKKVAKAKGGGLMEATSRLKAKGMKEGGMVAMDKSPNSGLITTKGFGAGRRT